MASNYPPGVTGNEFEIAGPDYEQDVDDHCPECGCPAVIEQGYQEQHWRICLECGHEYDVE